MSEGQQSFVLNDWEDHYNRLELMHENYKKNNGIYYVILTEGHNLEKSKWRKKQ